MSMSKTIETLGEDRSIVVVRAPAIPDAGALANALVEGGIRSIEFTFTTPGVERHLAEAAAAAPGAVMGAGTVLTARQAERAIEAGAQFLVTPGLVAEVAEVARDAGVTLMLGAYTPSEVLTALDLGSEAVKIFPAESAGPRHFAHLLGPFPGVKLVGSGGIDATNAKSFLDRGAFAVTAGSSVVSAQAVQSGDWAGITARARAFVAALG
jgi:2-dehydro-3-deoxyphosphogluconate aldolase/(4S)-4-hydroxy-2-oxoglutarate aldolase